MWLWIVVKDLFWPEPDTQINQSLNVNMAFGTLYSPNSLLLIVCTGLYLYFTFPCASCERHREHSQMSIVAVWKQLLFCGLAWCKCVFQTKGTCGLTQSTSVKFVPYSFSSLGDNLFSSCDFLKRIQCALSESLMTVICWVAQAEMHCSAFIFIITQNCNPSSSHGPNIISVVFRWD